MRRLFYKEGHSLDREWWAEEWDRTEYDQSRYGRAIRRFTDMLGGKCVECGSADSLQFDHIDPTTKKFAISKMWNRGDDVVLPELQKCQLLCKSCHDKKTSIMRSVAHGGGVSGRRNCKCEPCRIRKNEYMRMLRRRSRQRKTEESL